MAHGYKAVGWNRQKRIYDLTLAGGVVLYLAVFLGVGAVARPNATAEILLIRALGTCALLLLHIVLSIGPLCRIDTRFLPLLYNRRHLGVTLFVVAAAHGGLGILQFHAMGVLNPLVSVLSGNGRYDSLAWFPFQPLGLVALIILFLMAATSHDFWLANLTAPVWKSLHMGVYVAYGLVVAHVALGVLQVETAALATVLLSLGLLWIVGIHLFAARRETARDRTGALDVPDASAGEEAWVPVCRVDEIPDGRARIVTLSGERVAVFRYDDRISTLSNVCQHQNGTLGEGNIVGGCVVCPWHGYEYDPASGASPPPFTERVPTFSVRVEGDRVLVDPRPHPAGTRIEPAVCSTDAAEEA